MDVSFYKNISFLNLNLRVFSEMAVAEWNGKVIAESDKVEKVDGNLYFPKSSIKSEYFKEVSKTTHCPWKGDAKYYTLNVDGNKYHIGTTNQETRQRKCRSCMVKLISWFYFNKF
ncbi:hypothetical protein DSO57_1009609 [Entomophthora muscae]|uniref:Uncharacterized protein n=1 Tax=Entomophthora muscae TaxID=34485 RepID=A0ACC2SJK6_9FUNG|nr:hypothetical protein DSO57_1009609 [Entomophthora muscae]